MGDSDILLNVPNLKIHYRTKSTRKVVLIFCSFSGMKDQISSTKSHLETVLQQCQFPGQ